MLLYLPLAHNYGRLLHLSAAYIGFTIAFLPDPLQAAVELPRVRPTIFPSVPRVYEKIHAAVLGQFAELSGPRRRIADWALDVGRRVSRLRAENRRVPPLLAAQHRLADRLVYSKIKDRLGGRLRVANAGGAPLAREIAEFFHSIDILILEGYGLSEITTAATVNLPSAFRFGTVGKPLPGVELRIEPDGEILIRSNTVFAGYYHDEAATREVLDDEGFVHTGDVGHIDEDGFLVITDRKKDLIVTAGGKNVAPQNLENELKTHRIVSHAIVIGDRRPYIGALVTVDPEAVDGLDAGAVEARRPVGGRLREHRPVGLRADQALPGPAARLHYRGGRGDADAQVAAEGDPRALRGRGRRPRTRPTSSRARGCGGRRRRTRCTSPRRGWRSSRRRRCAARG